MGHAEVAEDKSFLLNFVHKLLEMSLYKKKILSENNKLNIKYVKISKVTRYHSTLHQRKYNKIRRFRVAKIKNHSTIST